MSRRLFLALLLWQAMFVSTLVAGATLYGGVLHPAAVVCVAVILLVYSAASAWAARCAWTCRGASSHVALAIKALPMIAILGTATGFLIAFQGDVTEVQQRVSGAATGILSTIVGVACALSLMLQNHVLTHEE